uniref:U-box domain-containing protein n=1 Tax=Zea mays TaxID=4577 RepID=A0A804LHN6_MAIZE
MSLYNSSSSASVDANILRWLSEKLQLVTIYDLNHESLTLHEMASGGDPGGIVEKMSTLLKEIKDFVQAEDPEMGGKSSPKGNSACPVIPDDFYCPISLDLMKDPVIVATGLMSEVKGMQQQHCLTCVFTKATRGRLLELDTTRTAHGD